MGRPAPLVGAGRLARALGRGRRAYPHLTSNLSAPDYSVTGSDSAEVTDLIGTDFTAAGAEQDVIVFDSDTLKVTDPEYQDVVNSVVKAA